MKRRVTKVHPVDNVLVALEDINPGEHVKYDGIELDVVDRVPAKHKFVTVDLRSGDEIKMYGVLVG